MQEDLRLKLPRTYELIDLIEDRNSTTAMFKDFEEKSEAILLKIKSLKSGLKGKKIFSDWIKMHGNF